MRIANQIQPANLRDKPVNLRDIKDLSKLTSYIYDKDEIDEFNIVEAINNHPLAKKPTNMRSKLAYKELIKNIKPTTKYLLPGQLVMFEYKEPKYKEELAYYDGTPLTLFCGITRTKDGNIREIGFNLHYYPPFTRAKVLASAYNAFKPYFNRFFNEPSNRPNMMISYDRLMRLSKANQHLAFGIKMYIPVLRGQSYVVPTRLFSTAFYTEGHFSKATLGEVQRFWRRFRPY